MRCASTRWPRVPSDAATRNDIRTHGLVARAPSTPVQSNDCPAFAHARDGQRRRYSPIDRSRRRRLTLRRALLAYYKSPGWPSLVLCLVLPLSLLLSCIAGRITRGIGVERHLCILAKQCRRRNHTRLVGLAPHLCSQTCHSTCTHTLIMHSHRLCSWHARMHDS